MSVDDRHFRLSFSLKIVSLCLLLSLIGLYFKHSYTYRLCWSFLGLFLQPRTKPIRLNNSLSLSLSPIWFLHVLRNSMFGLLRYDHRCRYVSYFLEFMGLRIRFLFLFNIIIFVVVVAVFVIYFFPNCLVAHLLVE